MTEKEAIKTMMVLRGKTQQGLAEDMKLPSGQSSINGFLNRNKHGLRFDILAKIMDALDFDIYAQDRLDPENKFYLTADAPVEKEKKSRKRNSVGGQPRKPKREERKVEMPNPNDLDLDSILGG